MTNWHVMVPMDLYSILSAPQVDAIQNTLIKNGAQTSRFQSVVGAVVAEVQNRIQRRGIPVSATALSVPPELVNHVGWLLVEQMQMGLTGFDWTPQQQLMLKRAHDVTEVQIQAGTFPITVPNDPAAGPTVQSGGGVTVVQRGYIRNSFRAMRGLT